jgi:hypothetical protein
MVEMELLVADFTIKLQNIPRHHSENVKSPWQADT